MFRFRGEGLGIAGIPLRPSSAATKKFVPFIFQTPIGKNRHVMVGSICSSICRLVHVRHRTPPDLQVSNHGRGRDGDPTSLRILLHICQHALLSDSILAVARPSPSSDFIKRALCSGLPPKTQQASARKSSATGLGDSLQDESL